MGGISVLQLAAAHPDKVGAIVMVEPAPLAWSPELKAGVEGMVGAHVPALHIAATPFNAPHEMSQWMPKVVNGWTVGAGHYNMVEVPTQVTQMIEAFVRNYV